MAPVPLLPLLPQHPQKPTRISALDPPSPIDDVDSGDDEERNYGVSYIKRESTRIWGVKKKTWLGRRLQRRDVRVGVAAVGGVVVFL